MENTPRKPLIAGVLTLATIGLGHIYSGVARKGVVLYLAGIFLVVLALSFFTLQYHAGAIFVLVLTGGAFLIYCVADAVRIARTRQDTYELKGYNKWYIYLLVYTACSLVLTPLTTTFIKLNYVEAYKIPAGSMIPTLLIGDHMLVDKTIYKKSEPSRGDIVVFPYRKKPDQDFVKRIIGVAGDIIEIKNKELFLNNALLAETYASHLEERIIPGKRNPRDNFGPITVPENSVFVLGDNRDNSNDSRFWGFVDKHKIKGKAVILYWSWDSAKSNIRWGRIGVKIN